jgi:PAS domain S-box-containing protein
MRQRTAKLDETVRLRSRNPNGAVEQMQAALAQERSICSAILDTVPALVLVFDSEFKILRFNRGCEVSIGYRFAEVEHRKLWPFFIDGEDASPFRAAVERLRKNVRPGPFESCWKKRDGSPVMIRWRLAAVFDDTGVMQLIIATGVDLTENKRLENAVIEISAREQRRIGQDLHDGLGQHLTGIAFLAKVQEQKLAEKLLPEAAEAAKIVDLVNEAVHKTRELARGLMPVLSGPHGLVSALQQWASEVKDIFRIECRLECNDLICITDDGIATHLFRIAQEAVHNAIRHGKAERIIISLRDAGQEGVLSIRDEGSGIDIEVSNCAGMGLRIMEYRARMIGGNLTIQRLGERGTLVTCLFPMHNPNDIE